RAVEDMTEKELREVTLTDGSKLMFLDEFLDLMTKHEGLYIEFEMKTTKYSDELLYGSGYLDKVAKAVLKAEPKGSTYCMTSFDTRALRYIKEKYPTAKLTYLTKEACDEKSLAIAEALGVKRIACRLEKTSYNGMKLAHKKGFIVNLWPGKNVGSFVRAWALGADIHCTDFPITVKKFAAEQTSWLKVKY
ncbi:MAG: glycerophosphodiester phosphodiesterase, partial [Alistipes sp.]|nr:glycerophosphodiester phosphodiesterase [Alistipes sp.]